MNAPFWRCAIVSLLLWALPVQWLAAAGTLPCAGHPRGTMHVVTESASAALPVTSHHDAFEGASGHNAGDAHGLLAHTHSGDNASSDAHAGQIGAQVHPDAKCASAGHCCLSSALVSTPSLPDFAQRSASADFATLAQHHRAPVLGGPERPPRSHAA